MSESSSTVLLVEYHVVDVVDMIQPRAMHQRIWTTLIRFTVRTIIMSIRMMKLINFTSLAEIVLLITDEISIVFGMCAIWRGGAPAQSVSQKEPREAS